MLSIRPDADLPKMGPLKFDEIGVLVLMCERVFAVLPHSALFQLGPRIVGPSRVLDISCNVS